MKERYLSKFDPAAVSAPQDLYGKTPPSLLFPFMTGLASGLLTTSPEKMVSKGSMAVRRLLHPVLMVLSPLFMSYRQVIDRRAGMIPDEPVIWCVNHSFYDDVTATVRCTGRHAYVMFGNISVFFNSLDGIGLYANGVVLCNRKVKKSKSAAVEGAKKVLEMGTDIIIFPEAGWNKTAEKPLMHFWHGVYRLAAETGCKVVPVVHYLPEPNQSRNVKGNQIHTVIADPLEIGTMSEKEGLTLLRDTMASWYYSLMEQYGQTTRAQLLAGYETADDAWEDFLRKQTDYPNYDCTIETNADYRPENITEPSQVWENAAGIAEIDVRNVSHVLYARHVMNTDRKHNFQRRI